MTSNKVCPQAVSSISLRQALGDRLPTNSADQAIQRKLLFSLKGAIKAKAERRKTVNAKETVSARMEGEVTFGVLPSEIAIHVLSFLPLQDILTGENWRCVESFALMFFFFQNIVPISSLSCKQAMVCLWCIEHDLEELLSSVLGGITVGTEFS